MPRPTRPLDLRAEPIDIDAALRTGVFHMPARAYALSAERIAAEDLLTIAKNRALDPTIFDERAAFFWGTEISNSRLDSYYTVMSPLTTLRNYAAEAASGVAFQESHNIYSLPLGRSLTGVYKGTQGNGIARVEADFYTLRGLTVSGTQTDDFISGIRAGITTDVSVGFSGGEYICSICQRDMLRSWECWHIPGYRYEPQDTDGFVEPSESDTALLAFATIENAHLREVSAVYEGATPGAEILKVYREAEAGRIQSPRLFHLVEARFRVRLPDFGVDRRIFASAGAPSHQEEGVSKTTPPMASSSDEALQARLTDAGVTADTALDGVNALISERDALNSSLLGAQQRLDAQDRELQTLRPAAAQVEQARRDQDELLRLRPMATEVIRLRPLEEEVTQLRQLRDRIPALEAEALAGRAYRADLIEEALRQGARALGSAFSVETYRLILEAPHASLEVIKRMSADWQAIGDARLPAGRQTRSDAEPDESTDDEEEDDGDEDEDDDDNGGEDEDEARTSARFRPRRGAIPNFAYLG